MEETFPSLNKSARIAGVAYIIAMATSIVGFIPPSQLIVSEDAAQTASNIIANERFFRVGIASNLLTYIIDVALIWALYQLLKPINQKLALLAVFLRLIETASLAVGVIDELVTVRLLTHPDYLKALEPGPLYAFARVAMSTYGMGFSVGFTFLGLGSTVFAYLFLKSNYIPKALAAWGIFSSLLIGLGTFAVIVFPEIRQLFPYGYGPIGIYEVTVGFWLLIKGVSEPERPTRVPDRVI